MNIIDLPIAGCAEDIVLLKKQTDALEVPGYLMSPEALSEALGGLNVVELARGLSDSSGNCVDGHTVHKLQPFLDGVMEFRVSSMGFSAIRHRSIQGIHDRPHTDHSYQDGAFWLCGETQGGLPRRVEMATVYDHIPMDNISAKGALPIQARLPFGVEDIYRGFAELGWGTYMLSKNKAGARTLHCYGNGGVYARLGEHDEAGLSAKYSDLKVETS